MLRDIETTPAPHEIEIPIPSFMTDYQPTKEPEEYFPTLSSLCTDTVSRNLNVENALDTYDKSDQLQLDELKLNALKFISLNIVSFLETRNIEKVLQLPIYLIRELENFLKLDTINKFKFFSMEPFDVLIEEALERQAVEDFRDPSIV